MVQTGTDSDGKTTFYADTNSSCNLLYAFSKDYKTDVLVEKDGEFFSTDESLVTTMANLMGLGFLMDEDDPTFYSVGFSSDEEGKLSFTLHPYAKCESYFQDESLTGPFEDVGMASYSPLEAYIEQNPFDSKNTLSEERAIPLNADMGKAITDIEVVYDDGIKEKDSTTERNYASDRTTTIYQTKTTRTRRDYYRAKASDVEEGLEEGGVYELRLEADNTIEKDPIEGISYEEVGGKPSLYLEDILSGSTRDGDYYFYHGYQADDFLTFLTGYHFLDTEELCLKVGENGIESLEASFGYGNEAYDENLQLVPYHYEATITFAAYEAIPDLAPFPEDEESQKVDAILANSVSGTYSYTAYDTAMKNDEGTYMRKETIISDSDVLVLDYGFTGDFEEIKGYRKNDENSFIPYEVTYADGTYTAKALSSPVPGKLSDYFTPLSVSPAVLTFLSDDVLVPKEGVKGFYGRIPTYENGKYIVDDSLRIEVDDETDKTMTFHLDAQSTVDEDGTEYRVELSYDFVIENIGTTMVDLSFLGN